MKLVTGYGRLQNASEFDKEGRAHNLPYLKVPMRLFKPDMMKHMSFLSLD
jgi:hypothetical protein